MTVLRQVAAHLDGWSGLRAEVATEVSWPSVYVTGSGAPLLWQCVRDRRTGQLFDSDSNLDAPVASIQTSINKGASASEVADGIKAIYRGLRTDREVS